MSAKLRGVSDAARTAQKAFVTGRKRAPFSVSTIEKMRAAAFIREAAKRT